MCICAYTILMYTICVYVAENNLYQENLNHFIVIVSFFYQYRNFYIDKINISSLHYFPAIYDMINLQLIQLTVSIDF
jgi:hypothetical protein